MAASSTASMIKLGRSSCSDRLRHREVEVPTQKRDRLVAHSGDALGILRVRHVELMRGDQLVRFRSCSKLSLMPVDDRAATQQQADGFELTHGKSIDSSILAVGLLLRT